MDEWMRWEAARAFLNISRDKMSKLVKTNAVASKEDGLDRRIKLVRRADVEKLLQETQRSK